MTPLRWTVIATQVPPGGSLGGVVRYTTELIRALAAREDVIVSAVTTKAARQTLIDLVGDGSVSTIPNAPVPVLSIAERHLPLPGLRHGPDVVQGIKHLVPRHTDALRVLTVHDMLLLDRPDDFGRGKRLLLPPFYRSSIDDADLLLCVSEATRRRMEAQLPGSSNRAAVVHLATSDSLRAVPPQPIAALAGRRFALVVGDSSPRKNLTTLMDAWAEVRAAVPDAVLAVAGPPSWGETAVGARFGQLVAEGSVIALGYVDEAELHWAYRNATVALCPSLAEGFGLPAAEALDLGAPVIVSDDDALQEVSAGRAFAVLPARDAAAWARSIAAAFDTARRSDPGRIRSWADVADETVAAVRQALDRRAAVAAG